MWNVLQTRKRKPKGSKERNSDNGNQMTRNIQNSITAIKLENVGVKLEHTLGKYFIFHVLHLNVRVTLIDLH